MEEDENMERERGEKEKALAEGNADSGTTVHKKAWNGNMINECPRDKIQNKTFPIEMDHEIWAKQKS